MAAGAERPAGGERRVEAAAGREVEAERKHIGAQPVPRTHPARGGRVRYRDQKAPIRGAQQTLVK